MLSRYISACILLLLCLGSAARSESTTPVRVLMTVGGVGYHTSIVRQLGALPTLELVLLDVDDAPAAISTANLQQADVLLMYHRDNEADAAEREALLSFIGRGGGVVVLHHAIANYPNWPHWWRDQIGGLYRLADGDDGKASSYFYGFAGAARPVMPHPVTKRLGPFWWYEDESYAGLWVSERSRMLLGTTASGSDGNLAWIGPSQTARVVYIQPGHGEKIMADPRYIALLEDAIHWTASALQQNR